MVTTPDFSKLLCLISSINYRGIPYISKDRHIRVNAIGQELAQGLYGIVALQEVWSEHDYHILKQFTAEVLPYTHYFYRYIIHFQIEQQ